MTMVQNLLERTVKALTERGYAPYYINHSKAVNVAGMPKRTMNVHETFRMNHRDEENVTVTVEIIEWHHPQGTEWLTTGKRLAKIKIPKDASEKVLSNRVEKAIETINQ